VLHGDDDQLNTEPRHEPRHVTRAAEHRSAMQKLRVRGRIVVDDSDNREVVPARVLRLAQQLFGAGPGANQESASPGCGLQTQFADIACGEHCAATEEDRQHPVDDEHRPRHVISQVAEIQEDNEQKRAERDSTLKADQVAETDMVPVESKHPPPPEDDEADWHEEGQGHEELPRPVRIELEVESQSVCGEIRQRKQNDVRGNTHPRATTSDALPVLAVDRTRSDHAIPLSRFATANVRQKSLSVVAPGALSGCMRHVCRAKPKPPTWRTSDPNTRSHSINTLASFNRLLDHCNNTAENVQN